MDISKLAKGAATSIKQNAPLLLSIASVAGVAVTAYLAHQAGVKATQDIVTTQIEEERVINDPAEKVRLVWKHYVPAASVFLVTSGCIIASNVISAKRQAAVIGAYAMSERAFNSYREKMVDHLGTEEEAEVRETVVVDKAEDILANRDDSDACLDDTSIDTAGKATFIDTFSGQMFITDLENVYRAMNATNKKCAEDGYASMNYFYSMVGGRRTDLGEVVGWNTDRMMDLIITRVTKDGSLDADIHIYGIDYREQPMMEYHRVW